MYVRTYSITQWCHSRVFSCTQARNVLEACAHVRTYVRMQNIRTRTYVCRYVSRLFSAFTARLQRAVISQDASGFVRTYVSKTILRK